MHVLVTRFQESAPSRRLKDLLAQQTSVSVSGLTGSGTSLLVADLADARNAPVVLLAEADELRRNRFQELKSLLGPGAVLILSGDAPSQLELLNALRTDRLRVVITDRAALAPRAVCVGDESTLALALQVGQDLDREVMTRWLHDAGYERDDLVTEPGEFTMRGGIVDVFPDRAAYPVRAEFLGNRLESLRQFDQLTQRSVSRINEFRLEARNLNRFTSEPVSSLLPTESPVVELRESGAGPDPVPLAEGRRTVWVVADGGDVDFGHTRPGLYLGNFVLLKHELASSALQYFILCPDEHHEQRLAHVLGNRPRYLLGSLSEGFVAARDGFAVLTSREIYGAPVMREVRRRFRGLPVDDLLALHKGDYVVHINYGVGVFEGIRRLRVAGAEHDFLSVRYAENNRVYVPLENLGLLDRYIGSDDRPPALDRLGSRSWQLARTRTAAAVADYAVELLEIYARRKTVQGFAFARDTPEQEELEAAFVHEETPDQLRAIGDVKHDMESDRPMDRLVCGDVAYGKTEVALRAAFKAVMDAKQVAVLVPTTILAVQHLDTFRARARQFPIRIAMLSRFAVPGERARVVEELAAGKIDIVIGTHMLLGARVKFRDLGLLIIDEEQRFGVRQKEQIKRLKAAVDVLTLSATPIPRTLYMALVGLRDISTIHTPPAGRREIDTDVQPWNDELVRRYVLREVNRGGQVFFIHNRIESLPPLHERLCRLCPELRIVMAHGQMPERRLAGTYFDFAHGEYDVLCSTAIVESGLDLPRVNTIVVNRADWFGLADLHQLRGRVGRTQEQGYALFIIPDRHDINEEARKRLSAIMAYSQLGSGFKLAMRDMEIRGVGNLLGVEQHGHVARVGFNLYVRLLKEAIGNLKGEAVSQEPELSIDVEAFLPEDFIADSYERVAIYKRLLSVESEAELKDLRAEMIDRFGNYPPIVENLFRVARVRVLARRQGLLRVSLKGNRIVLVKAKSERIIEGGLDRLLEVLGN